MASVGLGENVGVGEEIIKKACSMATQAHRSSPPHPYLCEKIRNRKSPDVVIFAFPGSWTVDDLYANSSAPYGASKVDAGVFPSLKYICLDEAATVNEAFMQRFKTILDNQQFKPKVDKAVADGNQVVFTGHSTGGPIAILAAIWFLEWYVRPHNNGKPPLCVTFGSPLVGDRVMNHALRRENWSRCFIHFVRRYDSVPRVLLTPRSTVERQLQSALDYFKPRSQSNLRGYMANTVFAEASDFYLAMLRNTSYVASFAACKIMGNTNPLSDTLSSIMNLSPYRPSGTYIFCTGNGKLVIVRNPDAILQILFYSLQLNSESELAGVAQASLRDHLSYEEEITESLEMESVTCLDDNHLAAIPLSSGDASVESATILNDLGLSVRARLCLRAAAELEPQKLRNQATIDEKKPEIIKRIGKLQEEYKAKCASHNLGYYEAFKKSERKEDFDANIARLELAGLWDEMMEMLKRHELPDGFECRPEWVDLGTQFRRLVEPLDIANYYRHLKNEDTGTYMKRGRPRRYKCIQRWREHALRKQNGSLELESCLWAELEELHGKRGSLDFEDSFASLKHKIQKCIDDGDLSRDDLKEYSTYKDLGQYIS